MKETFLIVLMWWSGGDLHRIISNEPMLKPECEVIAKHDEATQRQRFGNATATCVPVPTTDQVNAPVAPRPKRPMEDV